MAFFWAAIRAAGSGRPPCAEAGGANAGIARANATNDASVCGLDMMNPPRRAIRVSRSVGSPGDEETAGRAFLPVDRLKLPGVVLRPRVAPGVRPRPAGRRRPERAPLPGDDEARMAPPRPEPRRQARQGWGQGIETDADRALDL